LLIPCDALPVRIGVGEVSGAAPRTQRPSLAAGSFRLTRGWCGERGAGWARSGLAIPCEALPERIGAGEVSGAAPRTKGVNGCSDNGCSFLTFSLERGYNTACKT
jgi:hypothetical protein